MSAANPSTLLNPRSQPIGRPGVAAWTALFGGIALYLLAPVAGEVSQTRLYPSALELNLGTVKRGTTIKKEAHFWNLSPRTVSVQSVSSGCGCTAAVVKNKVVPPFSSTVIQIQLDTFGVDPSYAKDIHVEVSPMGKVPAKVTLRGRVVD